jgi:peptide chain release factor 1
MDMREQLEKDLERFTELEQMLQDPEVQASGPRMGMYSREHGSLAKVALKYRRFKELNTSIAETNDMIANDDADMRELAEAEIEELRKARETVWNELLDLTIGGEDANRTRIMMEIRAGTGGDEAALFARDLYDMYKHYCEAKGWKVEILDMSASDLGGFKEIVLGIDGEGVFRELQYESGGHRVQRVPETEAKGRIHTSAATVAVLPEPEDIEIDIKPSDYRLDKFCASGPGGQHVNKTESAVRLTHYETNIVVQCQDEKSQHKNIAKALRQLKTKLYEHKRAASNAKRDADRKTLIGSGDRSERIRTYNYPDNRVTDHRINLSLYKLDSIISGNVQPVIDALLDYARNEQRASMGVAE